MSIETRIEASQHPFDAARAAFEALVDELQDANSGATLCFGVELRTCPGFFEWTYEPIIAE